MKAVLKVVRNLSRRVEETIGNLRYLRNLRDSITPQLDGLPKNPNVTRKVEWLATAIADMEAELQQLKGILICCRIELCEWLNEKIIDRKIFQVMFLRYGQLKTFQEIAQETNYSESSIFKSHRDGLKILGVQMSIVDDYEFDNLIL